jgi:hypothetical protein
MLFSPIGKLVMTYVCSMTSMSKCIKLIYEGKSKSKGTFHHFYWKCTETKLISLCNVIPLDFNAPVPDFHKFLIPSEKKSFLVAYLTIFAPHQ